MGSWNDQNVCGRGKHSDRCLILGKLRSESGMSLVELMFGVGIFILLIAGLFAFNFQFEQMHYQFQIDGKQTNYVRSVIEQIIWGPRADTVVERRGVWTANSMTVNSANQISYTDTSGVIHNVRQNGQNIEYRRAGGAWFTLYDPNGVSPDDASRYSTSLTFTQTAQPTVIQIDLVLGQKLFGRWYYASMSTDAAYRN